MPITVDELTGAPAEAPTETPALDSDVRIVGWVNEIPRLRRSSPFDTVVQELRAGANPERIAQLEWGNKEITANKVNQLRKRYTDIEFTQVTRDGARQTFARYRGDTT